MVYFESGKKNSQKKMFKDPSFKWVRVISSRPFIIHAKMAVPCLQR